MIACAMRNFEVLFDYGEDGGVLDPAMARYGRIVSLLGDEAGGADIVEVAEDRWLMDLLRAHADAVLLGMGTLREEQRLGRPRARGPVFRIVDAGLQELRAMLGRGRERNVLLTARADFQMSDYAVFDGELVDVTVVTTREGAARLEAQRGHHAWVDIIAVDGAEGGGVDLRKAVTALEERYGIRYLLCEGGPSLYSGMIQAGLIDEKFVTVSPMEVGRLSAYGPRPTVLPEVGFSRDEAVRWQWLSCRKVDDYQFHRFRRKLKGIC